MIFQEAPGITFIKIIKYYSTYHHRSNIQPKKIILPNQVALKIIKSPYYLEICLTIKMSCILQANAELRSILIIIAMEAEAKPFVEKLGLKRVDTVFPAHVPSVLFQGTIKSCTISVVTNGKCPKHGVDNVSISYL